MAKIIAITITETKVRAITAFRTLGTVGTQM
jgi:hypothetical protein